jgi:uncharacterized membrane protein YkvA (DUF1232 family)
MLDRWKRWARIIKRDGHALYLAARDPRVPWYVKALAVAIAAYAFSPIDLVPDFIPLFGILDELVLLPAGIALIVWLTPPAIMAEHRLAADAAAERPVSRTAAVVIVMMWLTALALTARFAARWL